MDLVPFSKTRFSDFYICSLLSSTVADSAIAMPLVQQSARSDFGRVFQVFEFKDLCASGTAHAIAFALPQTACLNPLLLDGSFSGAGFEVASSPVLTELNSVSVIP